MRHRIKLLCSQSAKPRGRADLGDRGGCGCFAIIDFDDGLAATGAFPACVRWLLEPGHGTRDALPVLLGTVAFSGETMVPGDGDAIFS